MLVRRLELDDALAPITLSSLMQFLRGMKRDGKVVPRHLVGRNLVATCKPDSDAIVIRREIGRFAESLNSNHLTSPLSLDGSVSLGTRVANMGKQISLVNERVTISAAQQSAPPAALSCSLGDQREGNLARHQFADLCLQAGA